MGEAAEVVGKGAALDMLQKVNDRAEAMRRTGIIVFRNSCRRP